MLAWSAVVALLAARCLLWRAGAVLVGRARARVARRGQGGGAARGAVAASRGSARRAAAPARRRRRRGRRGPHRARRHARSRACSSATRPRGRRSTRGSTRSRCAAGWCARRRCSSRSAAASLWQPPAPGALLARARALALRVPPTGRARSPPSRVGVVALVAPLVVLRVLVMVAGAVAVLWGTASCCAWSRRRPRSLRGHARDVVPALGRVARGRGRAAAHGRRASRFAFTRQRRADARRALQRQRGAVRADARPGRVRRHAQLDVRGRGAGLVVPGAERGHRRSSCDDGVRALLIDTHYGFQTPRGVATDLDHDSSSREKIDVASSARTFVDTAQRLRARMGYNGGGTREVFLCHAFCEVGATRRRRRAQGRARVPRRSTPRRC